MRLNSSFSTGIFLHRELWCLVDFGTCTGALLNLSFALLWKASCQELPHICPRRCKWGFFSWRPWVAPSRAKFAESCWIKSIARNSSQITHRATKSLLIGLVIFSFFLRCKKIWILSWLHLIAFSAQRKGKRGKERAHFELKSKWDKEVHFLCHLSSRNNYRHYWAWFNWDFRLAAAVLGRLLSWAKGGSERAKCKVEALYSPVALRYKAYSSHSSKSLQGVLCSGLLQGLWHWSIALLAAHARPPPYSYLASDYIWPAITTTFRHDFWWCTVWSWPMRGLGTIESLTPWSYCNHLPSSIKYRGVSEKEIVLYLTIRINLRVKPIVVAKRFFFLWFDI